MYYAKRTYRYKNIQNVINFFEKEKANKTFLIDMDMNNSGKKRANIKSKIVEPVLFYLFLTIIFCIAILIQC